MELSFHLDKNSNVGDFSKSNTQKIFIANYLEGKPSKYKAILRKIP